MHILACTPLSRSGKTNKFGVYLSGSCWFAWSDWSKREARTSGMFVSVSVQPSVHVKTLVKLYLFGHMSDGVCLYACMHAMVQLL